LTLALIAPGIATLIKVLAAVLLEAATEALPAAALKEAIVETRRDSITATVG
jgi:hypothetical protein